jgi:hypothetical protein
MPGAGAHKERRIHSLIVEIATEPLHCDLQPRAIGQTRGMPMPSTKRQCGKQRLNPGQVAATNKLQHQVHYPSAN